MQNRNPLLFLTGAAAKTQSRGSPRLCFTKSQAGKRPGAGVGRDEAAGARNVGRETWHEQAPGPGLTLASCSRRPPCCSTDGRRRRQPGHPRGAPEGSAGPRLPGHAANADRRGPKPGALPARDPGQGSRPLCADAGRARSLAHTPRQPRPRSAAPQGSRAGPATTSRAPRRGGSERHVPSPLPDPAPPRPELTRRRQLPRPASLLRHARAVTDS